MTRHRRARHSFARHSSPPALRTDAHGLPQVHPCLCHLQGPTVPIHFRRPRRHRQLHLCPAQRHATSATSPLKPLCPSPPLTPSNPGGRQQLLHIYLRDQRLDTLSPAARAQCRAQAEDAPTPWSRQGPRQRRGARAAAPNSASPSAEAAEVDRYVHIHCDRAAGPAGVACQVRRAEHGDHQVGFVVRGGMSRLCAARRHSLIRVDNAQVHQRGGVEHARKCAYQHHLYEREWRVEAGRVRRSELDPR